MEAPLHSRNIVDIYFRRRISHFFWASFSFVNSTPDAALKVGTKRFHLSKLICTICVGLPTFTR